MIFQGSLSERRRKATAHILRRREGLRKRRWPQRRWLGRASNPRAKAVFLPSAPAHCTVSPFFVNWRRATCSNPPYCCYWPIKSFMIGPCKRVIMLWIKIQVSFLFPFPACSRNRRPRLNFFYPNYYYKLNFMTWSKGRRSGRGGVLICPASLPVNPFSTAWPKSVVVACLWLAATITNDTPDVCSTACMLLPSNGLPCCQDDRRRNGSLGFFPTGERPHEAPVGESARHCVWIRCFFFQ